MENLRENNPTQHATLLEYYRMYGHLLSRIQIERPASRAGSVKGPSTSFNHQFHTTGDASNKQAEESTILHPTDQTDQRYQPTPEVSQVQEESDKVSPVPEEVQEPAT